MKEQKDKITSWLEWQEKIMQDMIRLHGSRQIYKNYVGILDQNPAIATEGVVFHNWIVDNWITFTAMTIRRQADKNPKYDDTISLAKLIEDIAANPEVLTREYHISLYEKPDDDFWKGMASNSFTEHAGSGEFFDPEIANADLKKLDAVSLKVRQLATRSIAHSSTKPMPTITFDEVHACIDTFRELLQRYVLLLTAGWNLVDPVMDDWQEIFTRPWIAKKGI